MLCAMTGNGRCQQEKELCFEDRDPCAVDSLLRGLSTKTAHYSWDNMMMLPMCKAR